MVRTLYECSSSFQFFGSARKICLLRVEDDAGMMPKLVCFNIFELLLARMKFLALSYLLALTSVTSAFVAPATQSPTVSKTQLFKLSGPASTGWNSFAGIKDYPTGEEQRQLRRTVYTHDDWKKHRSQDRFVYYLAAVFSSGVYKNLRNEVFLTVSVASFVCLYNAICGGYEDLNGVAQSALVSSPWILPKLGLPMNVFTLTSPSLGLLLGTYHHAL